MMRYVALVALLCGLGIVYLYGNARHQAGLQEAEAVCLRERAKSNATASEKRNTNDQKAHREPDIVRAMSDAGWLRD